ncbi:MULTISPECIES: H-NS histone family protein [Bradyrhizobium]
MSLDELWTLHEQVLGELGRKVAEEKTKLEDRLRLLKSVSSAATSRSHRRPYPKVQPKYRNPKNPAETWAGRGKQPRWLKAQLRSGRRLADFLIDGPTGS